MQGYAVKYLRRHYWRMNRLYEFEDLVQEAHWLFCEWVRDRYPDVDNPAWAMALWKRILASHVTDLANQQTRIGVEVTESELIIDGEESEYSPLDLQGSQEHLGEFFCTASSLPSELRQVLTFLMVAPSDYLTTLRDSWAAAGRRKCLEDSHLQEVFGVPRALSRLAHYFEEGS